MTTAEHARRLRAGILTTTLALGVVGCTKTETIVPTRDSAPPATSAPGTTAGTAPGTTADPDADLEADAAEAFDDLQADLEDDYRKEAMVRDAAANEDDLAGAITASGEMREVLYDYDADLRQIEFPDDLVPDVNELLEVNSELIEVFDKYVDITVVADYNDNLDEEQSVLADWHDASDSLSDTLDVDRIWLSLVDRAGESTSTTSTSRPPGSAGDRFIAGVMVYTVPDGFTADGMVLQGRDGTMISGGTVSADRYKGMALAELADTYSKGVADKEGATITDGPTDVEVGNDPAIAYELTHTDGDLDVVVLFEREGKFYSVGLSGPKDAVYAASDAFEAVLGTLDIL